MRTQRPLKQSHIPQRSAGAHPYFAFVGALTTAREDKNWKIGPGGLRLELLSESGDLVIFQRFFGHDRGPGILRNRCQQSSRIRQYSNAHSRLAQNLVDENGVLAEGREDHYIQIGDGAVAHLPLLTFPYSYPVIRIPFTRTSSVYSYFVCSYFLYSWSRNSWALCWPSSTGMPVSTPWKFLSGSPT